MTTTPPSSTHELTSADGTRITYERRGAGPPVILCVGAFNTRSTGAPLAAFLATRFTVFTYDRRGRGDSGDTLPYAVEREIEDLAALTAAAGGAAAVFGFSSGAVLALRAAARGLPITKLALFDTPLDAPTASAEHALHLQRLLTAGQRGQAVEYFQARVVGLPEALVHDLRRAPFRPALERMAHTLVYESLILGDGRLHSLAGDLARITAPTLALAGGGGAPFLRTTAAALATAIPNAQAQVLPGLGHDLEPAALGPPLAAFFSAGPRA